jgi:hypothetical protein
MKTPLRDQKPLTRLTNITQHFTRVFVEHGGAKWHRQNQILSRLARAISPPAGFAVISAKTSGVAVINHGIKCDIALKINGSAITAIAAIRTPSGHIFFSAKTHATIAALPGGHFDCGFVNKFHGLA